MTGAPFTADDARNAWAQRGPNVATAQEWRGVARALRLRTRNPRRIAARVLTLNAETGMFQTGAAYILNGDDSVTRVTLQGGRLQYATARP